jgi:hypothetical protein
MDMARTEYPRLCQSITMVAPVHSDASQTITRAGMLGGFCTRM